MLFDFSKAFDTISSSTLIRKLNSIGLSRSVLCWIHSYIWGRKQEVVTKSESWQWVTTTLGVPQGSVLGPLLFGLYMNDMQGLFRTNGVRHILYADDHNEIHEVISTLSLAAKNVSLWAVTSSLCLNSKKTQAILFASKYAVKKIDKMGSLDIELGSGITIPFSKTVESLGVVLERTLSWTSQMDRMTKNKSCAIYTTCHALLHYHR